MKEYDETLFDAAVEITSAAAEEAEAPLNAAGGKAAAEFLRALYDALAAEDQAENAAGGRFELYRDAAKQYRFRLKAANGQIIAASEGYKTKAACLKGINSVQRLARLAEIVEADAE